MKYVFETHLHTCESSACSRVPGRDFIQYMKQLGYSGMIVTDHFFNGNSSVPEDLPWDERIELYCRGYENALAESQKYNRRHPRDPFYVFFGIEYNFRGDEYLLYGVGKDWLLANPDILGCSRTELCRRVHEGGGIMIQAHPFRERGYLSEIHLCPSACDGIETYNAGNKPYMNALALKYAEKYELRCTAGSDMHFFDIPRMGGLSFKHPVTDIKQFVSSFLAGDGTPCLRLDNGEFTAVSTQKEECETDVSPTLPVFFHEQ